MAKAAAYETGLEGHEKYDAKVQVVLDEFWPETTGLSALKQIPGKNVYQAYYNDGTGSDDQHVIVKSVPYKADLEATTDDYMFFLNYIAESVSVANYIQPGVEHSDDFEKLVTMSQFAPGSAPEKLGPDAPWSWITDEKAVRAQGAWWRDYRKKSIEFAQDHPEEAEAFPQYYDMYDGWEGQFTPLSIPITPETYGIVHGDSHTGNWMLDRDAETGDVSQCTIDFDNGEKAWFLVDLGTVVWSANMQYYAN